MKVSKQAALVLALGFVLAGCSTMQKSVNVSPGSVMENAWVLSSLNGQAPADGSRTTLRFKPSGAEAGLIQGKASCNQYFGHYEIKNGQIHFGRMGSTMMACSPELMKQERAYMMSLKDVDQLTMRDDTLILKNKEGSNQITFMGETAHVRGVIHVQGQAIPANSYATVRLKDLNNKNPMMVSLVGEQRVALRQQQPGDYINFDIPYAPHLIKKGHMYSVSVQIHHKGKLISESTANHIADLHHGEAKDKSHHGEH